MTSISISKELKRRLKVLAAYRDISYEFLLKDLLEVFENNVPFKTESEFCFWFEKNFKFFGFTKISRTKSPDYIVKDITNKTKRVEVELLASRYNHPPSYCDLIICAFSHTEKINNIPVLALRMSEKINPNVILTKIQKLVSWNLELLNLVVKYMNDNKMESFSEAVNKLVKKGLEVRK